MNNMERKIRLRQELAALRVKMAEPQKLPLLLARMKREQAIEAELKGAAHYAMAA